MIPIALGIPDKNNLGLEHVYVENRTYNWSTGNPWVGYYNLYDGNWGSYAYGQGGGWSKAYFRYVKPTNWTSNLLRIVGANWTMKIHNGSIVNRSLDGTYGCLDHNASSIQLATWSNGLNGDNPWFCGAAGGDQLVWQNSPSTMSNPDEEGIHWFFYNNSNVSFLRINVSDQNGDYLKTYFVNLTNGSDAWWATSSNGIVYFNISKDYYTYTASSNASYTLYSANITSLGQYSNQTLNITKQGGITLNLNFSDDTTHLPMTGINISVEVFKDNYSYVSWTNTSQFSINLNITTAVTYNIRYSAVGYTERFSYYSFPAFPPTGTVYYKNLYLSNGTTSVTATVYDQTQDLVEGVNIKYLRYNSETGNYDEVGQAKTNFEGEAILELTLETEFYKFVLEYQGGTLLETAPSYIYSDTIAFYVVIGEVIGEYFFDTTSIPYNLTFLEPTNRFRYGHNVPGGSSSIIACLKVTRAGVTSWDVLNNTCQTGSSGILYQSVDPINGTTYRADAIINLLDGEGNRTLGSYLYTYPTNNPFKNVSGLVWQLFLTLAMGLIFIYFPRVAVLSASLSFIIGRFAGLNDWPPEILASILLIGIIVQYVMGLNS